MNLGGDEMGKQDDVMKNGKRGGKRDFASLSL